VPGPTGYDTSPIGSIITHTSQTVPAEYLIANGQTVSEDNYPQLATYAAAEVAASNPLWAISGSAPHRAITVPDLRDRFIYSKGALAFGAKAGEVNHLLTAGESGLPSHNHSVGGNPLLSTATVTGLSPDGGAQPWWGPDGPLVYSVQNAGGSNAGSAHNNMPPYCVLAFLVKAKGVTADSGIITGPPGPKGEVLETVFANTSWGTSRAIPGTNVWTTVDLTGLATLITPAGAFAITADGGVLIRDAGYYTIAAVCHTGSSPAGACYLGWGTTKNSEPYTVSGTVTAINGAYPWVGCSGTGIQIPAGTVLYLNALVQSGATVNFTPRNLGMSRVGNGPAGATGPAGPKVGVGLILALGG
jgi:microcystin-dependent protein